jgi:cardiolipin synthase
MTAAAPHVSIWLGILVEIIALALVPLVVLRRKEPSSTAAWILALVFLPGLGATLFLLFGRDRVRLPVQWKRDADQALVKSRRHHRHASPAHRDALARIPTAVDRELFRISSALPGGEPSLGNAAALLVDGEATYAAIGEAIDAATHHVHAEYYLVERGKMADWFAEKLVAAARRGVAVRLLLDGFGTFWIARRWVRALRKGGVEVAFFLPARLIFFQPMNLRNHRKIVVVDGETAFTGGINISDEYRGVRGQAPWRDTHLRVRGPAAQALGQVFDLDWHFATRREITRDRDRDRGNDPDPDFDPPAKLRARAPDEAGDAAVSIVRSGPDVAGPLRETIHRLFFSAITLARSRVYVTTPYFIPDRAIIVALQTAAMRGVDVRLLLPRRNNHPFVGQAGRSFYEDLLWAGVAIHEYGPGMIHAKTMVVDGTVAMVGSANMDLRSFRLNFEVHALVRDAATAAQLEACFEADLALSSPIDPVSFAARPWTQKVIEGAARLLSPMM